VRAAEDDLQLFIGWMIGVWDSNGREVVDFYNEGHAPVPRQNWIWRHPLTHDMYCVEST